MATGLLHGYQIFATGYVSFATTFLYQVASTCYLQKKLISNTDMYHKTFFLIGQTEIMMPFSGVLW